MVRRLFALIVMIALVACLMLLVRRVYLHHQSIGSDEEGTSEVRWVLPSHPAASAPPLLSVQL